MNENTHTFTGTGSYQVVPMHSGVQGAVRQFGQAFISGLTARKDPRRENFFSAEVNGVCYYFHVYPKQKTAYLLSAEFAGPKPVEDLAVDLPDQHLVEAESRVLSCANC